MVSKEILHRIVTGFLETSDYYLVDLKVSQDNRIAVEIDAFEGVSIDRCIELNRYIESRLNRDEEDYELEVGSAGLTEPFKVLKQYEKNLHNEVETLTKSGKKITGILTDVKPESFTLRIERMEKPEGAKRKIKVTEDLTFLYGDIKTTKYIYRFK
jgi:ribosome maturation factor RimP